MNDWIEFRHIRYLLAIAEHKGIRAAAEQLHTSVSNLSVQANQFQELCGIRLYRKQRDGRIRLTDAGIAFIAIGRDLLAVREEAIAALLEVERGAHRSIGIGSMSSVDPAHLRLACRIHRELRPDCPVLPTHGDAAQLAEELISGELDAALVTLPFHHPGIHTQLLCRDRLVACLRSDHPLASKLILSPSDLDRTLTVFDDPRRHPEAHSHLMHLLESMGIEVEAFSRASHPSELQELIREENGLALVRAGSIHDPALTTRPIAGTVWFHETAMAFHREASPRTIPILARVLRRRIEQLSRQDHRDSAPSPRTLSGGGAKRPPQGATDAAPRERFG